jgi:hypothetical protein
MLPASAYTATLYVDPDVGVYERGDTFVAKIRIDNEDECINAVQVELAYSPSYLRAVDTSVGRSILTHWIERPTIDKEAGRISFVGGVPGGYCGRIPGDPGLTNILAEVVFQPRDLSSGEMGATTSLWFTEESRVLLADGMGTEAPLTTLGAEYTKGEVATMVVNTYFDELRADTTPPEPFTIELVRESSVFGGRYFIVFSTTDKQSGIDHYQVRESDIDREGFVRGSRQQAVFTIAESPYPLRDQTLNSVITVRAVDKAGNIRTAVFVPDESMRYDDSRDTLSVLVIASGLLLLFLALIWGALRMRRARQLSTAAPEVSADAVEQESSH